MILYLAWRTIFKMFATVNIQINAQICHDTIAQLTDDYLMDKYKTTKSKRLKTIKDIVGDESFNAILPYIIPAGTKGVIRGREFNCIVKQFLLSLQLPCDEFDLYFEQQCPQHLAEEIPDWYIISKKTGKILLGMNQVDLHGGGAQRNRAAHYLANSSQHNLLNQVKLLCVICNYIQFHSDTKICRLFYRGFENKTLCYLKGLKAVIFVYFALADLDVQSIPV